MAVGGGPVANANLRVIRRRVGLRASDFIQSTYAVVCGAAASAYWRQVHALSMCVGLKRAACRHVLAAICDQQPERVFQPLTSEPCSKHSLTSAMRFNLSAEESICVVRILVMCTCRLAYTVWHLRSLGHHHKGVRLSKVVALAVLVAMVAATPATPLERLLSALERRHPPAIAHSQRVPTSTTALSSTLVMWQACSCLSCGSLCVYRLAS